MATTQIKDGYQGGSDNQLKVNPDGSITVTAAGGGFGGPVVVTNEVTIVESGLNSFQTSQYTIGLVAVQLAPTSLPNRSSISITISADPNIAVYIGNSSAVSVSNGYPLYDGSTLQLDLTSSGQIWAISSVEGQIAAILEIA